MRFLAILTTIADSQVQAMLSDQVSHIVSGTSLLIVGLLTIAVAALRRQSGGVVAVFWLGIWSTMYGAQQLNDAPALVATLPQWLQLCIPYLHASITYLMVVAGALTFRELTTGRMRQFLGAVVLTGLLIAVLGIGRFVATGEEYWLVQYNNLLAAFCSTPTASPSPKTRRERHSATARSSGSCVIVNRCPRLSCHVGSWNSFAPGNRPLLPSRTI